VFVINTYGNNQSKLTPTAKGMQRLGYPVYNIISKQSSEFV